MLPGSIAPLFPPPYAPELKPPPATPLSFAYWSPWLAPPKENPWDKIREKIFKNHALKSIDALRAKLEEALLSMERKPEIVKSIPSFPYVIKSL